MGKLRVAVDARPLSGTLTGIGRYTYEILKRLIKLDSDIEWYLYSHRPLNPELSELSDCQLRLTADLFSPFNTKSFIQVMYPYWARKDRVDIFWSPRHQLPMMLPRNMKKVVTIHDLTWKYYPESMRRFGWLLDALFMPYSLKISNRVLAVSRSTKRAILKEFKLPEDIIEVTPLAASNMKIEKALTLEKEKYFLFVGTIEPRKNIFNILQAFKLSLDKNILIQKMVIVGAKGWRQARLREFLIELDIEDHVEFLGFVDDEKLAQLYQRAYALIWPSLYEGFGLPILEAQSFGVPVITSDSSSMPEVAGKGAIYVDPHSITSISEGMCLLAQDSELHLGLSKKAKLNSKLFSWDSSAQKTLEMILN